ncbi:hypothetical protein JCM10212_002646 [Sporobolomyces blumeae]
MSSPPLPPTSTAPSNDPVIRALPDATDEALSRLIEGARNGYALPTPGQYARTYGLRAGTYRDDANAAADSLMERHVSRRDLDLDLELEWDERDNARRARALLDHLWDNPPPNALVDIDDAPGDEPMIDDDIVGEHMARIEAVDEILGRRDNSGLGLGGRYAERFPHLAGMFDESDEDEDDDDEDDEPMFGFDGDGLEQDVETAVWEYQRALARRPSAHDGASIWPGLLGEEPLNSPPAESSGQALFAPPPVRAPSSRQPDATTPLDPSSSRSYTSFLAAGATFVGHQMFGRSQSMSAMRASRTARTRPAHATSTRRPLAYDDGASARTNPLESDRWGPEPSRSASPQRSSTAHPAFAPFPSATATRVFPRFPTPSSSTSPPAPSYASIYNRTADPTQAFLLGPLRPSSSHVTSAAHPAESTSSVRALSARYAPYSSPSLVLPPLNSSTAANPAPHASNSTTTAGSPSTVGAAARRISSGPGRGQEAVVPRQNPASWREVADELLGRLRGIDEPTAQGGQAPNGTEAAAACSCDKDEEKWSVTILSYDPSASSITGLMNAYGIQSTKGSKSPTPSRVTTFFSSHIVDPLLDGLFLSPSPTGSGGNAREGLKASQGAEAESWIQVGPFKGMLKDELLKNGRDRAWLERETRGWILMRWKERDFVNVKATDSTLSINGFYHVALNRSTGAIEGLYSDPASTPYQRLDLFPSGSTGAYSIGSFSMR